MIKNIFNKIFTFKNIMFCLCIGIAIISTFFSCEVRAYTWTELNELSQNYNNFSNIDTETINTCKWLNNNKAYIEQRLSRWYLGAIDANDFDNFYVCSNSNQSFVYAWKHADSGYSYSQTNLYKQSGISGFFAYGFTNQTGLSSITAEEKNNIINISNVQARIVLIDIEPTSALASTTITADNLIPPFTFTPAYTFVSGDYNYQKMQYVGNIYLGEFAESNEFYELQVRFRQPDRVIIGSLFVDNNGNGQTQDNALILDNNYLFVNSVYLYYYQPYYLNLTIYTDRNNYTEQTIKYMFIPYNAVIENGQIVSSGDTTFNGQDMAIFIGGVVEGVVGSVPSGDSPPTGIIGGIYSLFVPDSTFFTNYFNDFNTFLTERYGILYQPFTILYDLLNRINNIDFTDQEISIGPFYAPTDDTIVLIPLITFDFSSFDNEPKVASLHNLYYLLVDGFLIFGLIKLCFYEYNKIFGGDQK